MNLYYVLLISLVIVACAQHQSEELTTTIEPVVAQIITEPPLVTVKETPAVRGQKEQLEIKIKSEVWVLKNGKLKGPGNVIKSKKISTIKNPKSPGTTSEYCWNYGKYAIVEVLSTDEKGLLDLYIRYPSSKDSNLCNPDFNGTYKGLNTIDGNFAGTFDNYILVDGLDIGEGVLEFQIFQIEVGKEIFKSVRNPNQEFSITKNNDIISLDFFGKLVVKCELALDTKSCWRKILELNHIKKPMPAPDCSREYTKAKVELNEPALVTTQMRVSNILKPNIQIIGGKSTCSPAP